MRCAGPLLVALILIALGPAARAGLVVQPPCVPGTSSPSGRQPCTACAPGTFASSPGATQCLPCPKGTYADEPGNTTCVRDQALWPVPSVHCAHDLETCIESGIRDGGIVEVAADVVAAQSVLVIDKSFTLRPQPGRVPVFDAGTSIRARCDEADMEVVIEGLVIESGFIEASQRGPHPFQATIRDNEIQRSSNVAIELSSLLPSNAGPTLFRVEDNRVTIDRSQTFSASVSAVSRMGGTLPAWSPLPGGHCHNG